SLPAGDLRPGAARAADVLHRHLSERRVELHRPRHRAHGAGAGGDYAPGAARAVALPAAGRDAAPAFRANARARGDAAMNLTLEKDVLPVAPQLFLAAFAMLVLVADALQSDLSKRGLANFCLVGLAAAAGLVIWQWPEGEPRAVMYGMLAPDLYTAFFNIVFL